VSHEQRLQPRDRVRGPDGAPAVLVYGDYGDPFTRAACTAVEAAGARLAVRHLPRGSPVAAVAAEAAAELGAFWPMHDALLAHDGPLDAAGVKRYAAAAGLDAARFEAVFGSDAHLTRIREDVRSAVAAGVDEAPALFLDGERLPTYDAGWLRERLARCRARGGCERG
jgi:protein-disulfide isomerase